jgi:hypothetical protein
MGRGLCTTGRAWQVGARRARRFLGHLSGWFKVPGARQTNQFKGVLLQEQNRGDGYFLGTNQSGRVLLGPAP